MFYYIKVNKSNLLNEILHIFNNYFKKNLIYVILYLKLICFVFRIVILFYFNPIKY